MKKPDSSEGVRIQKVMSQAGFASRRRAEQLILDGSVFLNGEPVVELGQRMIPGVDKLEVLGEPVKVSAQREQVVYALYKPKNCITTLRDPQRRQTIVDYFPTSRYRLFPIGRLDYQSEGLLLITNDGEISQRILHPEQPLWKGYFVKVKGVLSQEQLQALLTGLQSGKKKAGVLKVKMLHTINDKTWLEVSLPKEITEKIKWRFADLGYPIQKIKRYRIGSVTLEELRPGQSRQLTHAELKQLLEQAS